MIRVDAENSSPLRATSVRHLGFPAASYVDRRFPSIREIDREEDPGFNFNLGDPLHDQETAIGHVRNTAGYLVNSWIVQSVMTFLIVSNAIILGVLTLDSVRFNNTARMALEYLDFAILITFTVEFGFQLVYLGPVLIRHTWQIFDLVVVVFSWIFLGSGSVFRAFRVFRIISLASKWTSMQKLFTAIGEILPKLGVVAGMLLLLFYAATVLCTSLFATLYEEGYLDYDYFGRLDLTFITLFQMLTTDSWLVIVRQVMDKYYWSYCFFFGWVSLTSIIILNLIVAIICESLVHIKQVHNEANEIKASEHFRSNVPVDCLLKKQEDIASMQAEMELAINALMLRIPISVGNGS